jgi:hypothetical protein
MNAQCNPTVNQERHTPMLDKAIKQLHSRRQEISKQIKTLEVEGKKLGHAIKVLAKLSGKTAVEVVKIERKKISAAGRRAIAKAQKARWAKIKGKTAAKPAKKKRTMSVAAKKRIAAFQKARWAKIKAAKKK